MGSQNVQTRIIINDTEGGSTSVDAADISISIYTPPKVVLYANHTLIRYSHIIDFLTDGNFAGSRIKMPDD